MIIIVSGVVHEDGSVGFPEGIELPAEYFECLCHNQAYYFFSTKVERDTFYDERGIPHD
jgi:hypothetical protein